MYCREKVLLRFALYNSIKPEHFICCPGVKKNGVKLKIIKKHGIFQF